MRTFLPMICLLARVAAGNMEIESRFSDMTRSRHENDGKFENQTEKSGPWMDDASKEWNGEPDISLAMETDRKEDDPDGSEAEMADESKGRTVDILRNVAKRREEPMDSWLDATANEKGYPQEKKDPWTYWWGDKRISSHGQNPGIRRPIRVPFNSWGGKRGRVGYLRHPESNRFADDRIDSDHGSVDGYGVKRRAEIERAGWKTPFSSWGGKRARNANAREDDGAEDQDQDRDRYSERSPMRMTMAPYLDLSVGSSPPVHRILDLVADEFAKSDKAERFKGGPNNDGWTVKPNNFPYRKPNDDNGNWLVETYRLIAAKKAEPPRNKTLSFGPWHGKRNLKTYTLRLGDEYLEVPRRSAKEGLGFFQWAG